MRSLISLLLLTSASAATLPSGYAVRGEAPAAWGRILSSVGFPAASAGQEGITVLPAGSVMPPDLLAAVEAGGTVILEGESPASASLGFRSSTRQVRAAGLIDMHRPSLLTVWQKALELPVYEVPAGSRVFSKERTTGAPLVAGMRRGAGAVLWVATPPGDLGYERYPYLTQALADLGVEPPLRGTQLWAFFDYSYRTRADLDYLAVRWREAGIAALHVAAWHFYEADGERDRYLEALIKACHRRGILVYAWVELPHVSEKFWNDHPEWREKTAVGQDAHLDWRKLMNLFHPECREAVQAGVSDLLRRFDWDGVNLAELYFESLEGTANPSRFTPMNADVRAEFRKSHGFDPIEIFGARKDAASVRDFLEFRAGLARRLQEDWMGVVERARKTQPWLDLVLTHVDDRFDAGMRDAIGADAARVLPLLKTKDFTFLIEDPATVWHLGPQRYPEIARRYQPLTRRTDRLAIDINIVDRYQDVYPTKQQTGTELFQLVHLASAAFARVALYFENSILPPDMRLLPAAAAAVKRFEMAGGKLAVDSAAGVGVRWSGAAMVDGHAWPVRDGRFLYLPAGPHTVEAGGATPEFRLADFNGTLKGARALRTGGVEFAYESGSRAIAILNSKPRSISIDGQPEPLTLLENPEGTAVLLPRGQHLAVILPE